MGQDVTTTPLPVIISAPGGIATLNHRLIALTPPGSGQPASQCSRRSWGSPVPSPRDSVGSWRPSPGRRFGRGQPPQSPDEGVRQVYLPPLVSLGAGARGSVVVVVPALAVGQQGDPPVIRAVVRSVVVAVAPPVGSRVHKPGDVPDIHRPDHDTPQKHLNPDPDGFGRCRQRGTRPRIQSPRSKAHGRGRRTPTSGPGAAIGGTGRPASPGRTSRNVLSRFRSGAAV
jgi:hypothetical protein